MARSADRLSFFPVLLLVFAGFCECLQRTLDFKVNEGCGELCKDKNVMLGHVIAQGPNDTLHYLWDFTENPTVLIAATSYKAKLQINWKNYLAKVPLSLNFTEKPIYTFGVSIEKLIEFNDVNDGARLNEVDSKNITEVKWKNFKWHYENLIKYDNMVELRSKADNYVDTETSETREGKVHFKVQGFGTLNHSRIAPCMLHSENATQIDIVIDNLATKKGYSSSRFAFELLIVSENNANESLAIDTKRKLDDEFTPGIFETMELTTPLVKHKSGYLEWRPVSYLNSERDVAESTTTLSYPLRTAAVDDYFTPNNLLTIYYGENMFNCLSQRINISIGEQSDGFYKDKKYSTMTFIVGYGTPANERFSNIVIMIISIGVGLPMLILMISGIYVCARRIPSNESVHR